MAGWKLRKDKATAEAPGSEPTADAPTEEFSQEIPSQEIPIPVAPSTNTPSAEEPVFLDSVPTFPDFESDNELHFTDIDFGSDDEPLKLVDYSEPENEKPPVANLPSESPALDTSAWEMPPPAEPDDFQPASANFETNAPDDFQPAPDDFQERLRAGRSEASEMTPPAADFGFSIPSVAPFVLDTPPPAAPPTAAPQITLRIGRLSATFPITKEVTTIGRPDSILHSYPDVEIEMDDAVSRRHAEILKRADGFYVADAGSTNGTLLNGEILPPHQERLLAHGDRIRVGDRTEIIFE